MAKLLYKKASLFKQFYFSETTFCFQLGISEGTVPTGSTWLIHPSIALGTALRAREGSDGAASPNSIDTPSSPDQVWRGWACRPGLPDLPPTLGTPVVSLPRPSLSTACGRPVLLALPSLCCPHSVPSWPSARFPGCLHPQAPSDEEYGHPHSEPHCCHRSLIVTAYNCPHILRNPHSAQPPRSIRDF